MLREGWDVQSVTVIVGLRPYSAKANILPEQTVGRGLRLMFRGNTPGAPLFRETVDVIGNQAFIEFVEQLERDEDMAFETFDLDKDHVVIETIFPDPEKVAYDIILPTLSPHNRLAKCAIGDLLSTRKTNKPSVFEDSHERLLNVSHMVLLFK
jgi:type III restriction enzyme